MVSALNRYYYVLPHRVLIRAYTPLGGIDRIRVPNYIFLCQSLLFFGQGDPDLGDSLGSRLSVSNSSFLLVPEMLVPYHKNINVIYKVILCIIQFNISARESTLYYKVVIVAVSDFSSGKTITPACCIAMVFHLRANRTLHNKSNGNDLWFGARFSMLIDSTLILYLLTMDYMKHKHYKNISLLLL